jgi:hypothetical protein
VLGWILALAIGVSLSAILAAGNFTRDSVRNWDRYTIAFADIECTLPPGQARHDFLAEVQYVAGMANRLSVLEENLAARLADAFAQHPFVEQVEKVTVFPTRHVQVQLRFRPPASAPQRVLPADDLP